MNLENSGELSGLDKIKALKQEQELKRQKTQEQEKLAMEEQEEQKTALYQKEKESLLQMTNRRDEITDRLKEIKSRRAQIIKTGHAAVEEAREDEEVEKILHTSEGFDDVFVKEKAEWKELQTEVTALNDELAKLESEIAEKEKYVDELFLETKEGKGQVHEQKRQQLEEELLSINSYYLNINKLQEGEWNPNNINGSKLEKMLKDGEMSKEEIVELLSESAHRLIDKSSDSFSEERKQLLHTFTDLNIEHSVLIAEARNIAGNGPFQNLEYEKKGIQEEKELLVGLSHDIERYKQDHKDILDEPLYIDQHYAMPQSQWAEKEVAERDWSNSVRQGLSREDEKKWKENEEELKEHLKNKPLLIGREKWQFKKEHLEKSISTFKSRKESQEIYARKNRLYEDSSGIQALLKKIKGNNYDAGLKLVYEKLGGVESGITIRELLEKMEAYYKKVKESNFPAEKQALIDEEVRLNKEIESVRKKIIDSRAK